MILDTNAVSAVLAGNSELLQRVLGIADRHHLALPVIAEYQFGLRQLSRPRRLQSLFRRLEAESLILFPDRATADVYASIRHELKVKGRPIPEHDIWIAAWLANTIWTSLAKTPTLISSRECDALDGSPQGALERR